MILAPVAVARNTSIAAAINSEKPASVANAGN